MKAEDYPVSLFAKGKMPMVIDYNLSLREMIALGKYDHVDPVIKETNFPVLNKDENKERLIYLTGKLFSFREPLSSEEIILKMQAQSFIPANLPELLYLGKIFPNLQMAFSIIALASTWKSSGDTYSPGLFKCMNNGRGLKVFSYTGVWPSSCRFLGVQAITA